MTDGRNEIARFFHYCISVGRITVMAFFSGLHLFTEDYAFRLLTF